MVRVRKLVLAIAAATSLTSGMTYALGLGEVTLKSALNQPLQAEIELLDVKGLETDEVRPKLASPEDFAKAGVDRQFFLTDLKFTPALNANGKNVIRVTSSKPVREPYLNFMVEVLWPSGRLLREYTLLLDPPLYSPETAAAVAPQLPVARPVTRPPVATAPRPAPAPAPSAAPATAPRPSAPAASAPRVASSEYRTTSRDTLWEVAQQVRSGGTVHQAMLAIQDLNPDAFLDGNINRMKSGQVLRLPTDEQIRSRSQSEALAQVAAQNAAWRSGRRAAPGARQLDATRRAEAGAAPAQSERSDNLRLVAPEAGSATSGSDAGGTGGGNSKALVDKLAVTQESLDSSRRESAELKSRVDDLQSQLDKLQRLIQLKDSQLAKLQASVAEQGQAPATPAAPATASPAPTVPTPAPAAPTENQPAGAQPSAPAGEPDATENAAGAPATAPEAAPAEPAAPVEPQAEQAPAPVEPTPEPAPAQPLPAADEPDEGILGSLLANPTMLALLGGGALLLLLIALLILSRRNSAKETVQQNNVIIGGDDAANKFDSDMGLGAGSFDALDDDPQVELSTPVSERVTPQTGDPLGEADIYIAYGRFNQAAELLQGAINDEPQRADLRLKLMEVYAELGDREGFVRQENELREMGGSSSDIDSLKLRYPAMSALAAAALASAAAAASRDDERDEFNLDDLAIQEPAPSAALDDHAFDLDDLDLDFDTDTSPAAKTEPADDLGDLSLDDDLQFASTSSPAAEPDLDFDLDLDLDKDEGASSPDLTDELADFNLDLDAQEADEKPLSADDDFLFNLEDEPVVTSETGTLDEPSFELPQEPVVDPRSSVDAPLADFDLSLDDDEPVKDDFAAQLDRVAAQLDQMNDEAQPPVVPEPVVDEPFDDPFADAPMTADTLAGPSDEDDFDFLSGTDETATKLDLARAYIDMGDSEGARDILDEVLAEGDSAQQQEAREMISRLV